MDTSQAYQLLNLDQDATFDEIKMAYRKLALESHPDRNNTEREGKRFKMITEAYQLLRSQREDGREKVSSYSSWVYKNEDSGTKTTFGKKTRWGASQRSTPEEDWSRYTKGFEEEFSDFWKEYERRFWEEYDANINSGNKNKGFENVEEPKEQPDLFVDVDKSLCIGCCSCETIAPEVFLIDKHSKMNPKSNVINEKGAGINKIMNAAETCPTKAIIVEDRDKNERLYPL